jgi:hypothetical protein
MITPGSPGETRRNPRPRIVAGAVVLVAGALAFLFLAGPGRSSRRGGESGTPGTGETAGSSLFSNGPTSTSGVARAGSGAPEVSTEAGSVTQEVVAPNPALDRLVAALKALEGEADPSLRTEALKTLVAGIADSQIAATLTLLSGTNFAKRGEGLRHELLGQWAERDARAAAAFVKGLPPGALRAEAYGDVARGWAAKDAGASLAWALQLSPGEDRDSAVIQAAYLTAREQPMTALTAAVELSESSARNELLAYAASQWATESPQAAVDWAKQIPDETTRDVVLSQLFATWGDVDPVTAATAAIQGLPAGRAQSDAVVGVVQHWVQQDPEKAAAWVGAFPPGDLAVSAARELVVSWTDRDREQPGNWLNSLAPGAVRDAAVSAYVSKINPDSPASAAAWASGIGDEARRNADLERVGARWMEVDPAAARGWIQQSALPAPVKTRLLSIVPPPAPAPAPAPAP